EPARRKVVPSLSAATVSATRSLSITKAESSCPNRTNRTRVSSLIDWRDDERNPADIFGDVARRSPLPRARPIRASAPAVARALRAGRAVIARRSADAMDDSLGG